MRHAFSTMGTVASIDLPRRFENELALLQGIFTNVDKLFSLYRPDSELSRIANGSLALTNASAPLRQSFERSMRWRTSTAGRFNPNRPDGVLDLNGIVKAEAIERAGAFLDSIDCARYTINVGGDILARSATDSFVTAIADPTTAGALLGSVNLGSTRRALATSGSAERGDHIWGAAEKQPAHFVQVSVLAADIVTADVLATAIVAGGPAALEDITAHWDVDVLTVGRGNELLATPGFRARLGLAGV